jgi:hypothetical protein
LGASGGRNAVAADRPLEEVGSGVADMEDDVVVDMTIDVRAIGSGDIPSMNAAGDADVAEVVVAAGLNTNAGGSAAGGGGGAARTSCCC